MKKQLSPTSKKERLMELDVIRGFALFGILVVNMSYFSTPALYADMLGIDGHVHLIENVLRWGISLFFEFKFVSLFSLLFGISFAMFLARLEHKKVKAKTLFKRRLRFLLVLGLIHLLFFWYGDILTIYALLGFLLPIFVTFNRKIMLWWVCLLPLIPILLLIFAIITKFNMMESHTLQTIEHLYMNTIHTYGNGSFIDIFKHRLIDIMFIYQGYILMIPVIFSMFLFGIYAWKSGYISEPIKNVKVLKQMQKYSLIIGAPFALIASFSEFKVNSYFSPFYYIQFIGHAVSGPALAIFYMISLLLILQKHSWKHRLSFLQPVGRMALTNYLMQTLICTNLFYSTGFGLFNQVNTLVRFGIATLIFIAQVIISQIWLQYYQMGPLEAIWRKYTYQEQKSVKQQI
ncbi:DUF418 domain-containing protein [Gracilibacillus suaedae]|uniref:DUF418 domain-containing protein n=1 Tax=Gracilibacillus suaedae TaxID=2820273 RepID=UPI001ABE2446|nr:DUF418 domain-containing protein [Gracilibacillus suaedae]